MREALLSRRSPCPAQAALRLPENSQEPTCLIESSRRGRSPFVNRREAGPLSCRAAGARSCRRGRENPKGEDARAAAGDAAGIGPDGACAPSIARRAISRPGRFVFARSARLCCVRDCLRFGGCAADHETPRTASSPDGDGSWRAAAASQAGRLGAPPSRHDHPFGLGRGCVGTNAARRADTKTERAFRRGTKRLRGLLERSVWPRGQFAQRRIVALG